MSTPQAEKIVFETKLAHIIKMKTKHAVMTNDSQITLKLEDKPFDVIGIAAAIDWMINHRHHPYFTDKSVAVEIVTFIKEVLAKHDHCSYIVSLAHNACETIRGVIEEGVIVHEERKNKA